MAWPQRSRDTNSVFRKLKTADGRHIANRLIAILTKKSSDFDIWYTNADLELDSRVPRSDLVRSRAPNFIIRPCLSISSNVNKHRPNYWRVQMYTDQNHDIRSPGQSRHLYRSMTDFLLNDCWPQPQPQPAASTGQPPSSDVVMATLVAAVTSSVSRRH